MAAKRYGLWAAGLLAAVVAAWAFTADYEPISDQFLDLGEALIHGLEPAMSKVSYAGPFQSVSSAVLFSHQGGLVGQPSARAGLFFLVNGALVLLTHSVAPLAALAFSYRWTGLRIEFPHLAYTFFLLMIVGILMWRARRPTWKRTLLLGLSIGMTLHYRSPLAFFPPVLAAYEWVFLYRRSLRLYWRHLVLLCVLPYLFLVPWLRMNWVVFKQFVPFENGEVSSNIVVGALGLTQTVDGNWQILIDDPEVDSGRNDEVLGWAAHRVLSHPLQYAKAYAGRVAFWLGLNPVIALMALCGLWLDRRRQEYRQLGLLTAYFAGIHCFMSVSDYYSMPFWHLAAIPAGRLLDRLIFSMKIPASPSLYRVSRAAMGAAVCVVLASCLAVNAVVIRYGRRAAAGLTASPQAMERAVRESPRDAWVLVRRSREWFRQGEVRKAAEDLEMALTIDPEFPLATLHLAWARMLLGQPQSLFEWRTADRSYNSWDRHFEARILKAHGYARFGRREEMDRELRAALAAYKIRARVRGSTRLEMEAFDKLRSVDSPWNAVRMVREIDSLLVFRPLAERLDLALALSALLSSQAAVRIEMASMALRAGDRAAARTFLAEADRLGGDFQVQRILDGVRRELESESAGDRPRSPAASALSAAEVEPPAGPAQSLDQDSLPGLWIERALLAARAGDRKAAHRHLYRARVLKPGLEDKSRMASVYEELKDYRQALSLVETIVAESPDDPRAWIHRASLAARTGGRAWAARYLEAAQRLDPGLDDQHRMALLYQDLRDYDRSAQLLARLVRARPRDAALIGDRGVCEYFRGNVEQAVSDLHAAIKLEPGRLEAYVSLGSIYVDLRRYEEAARVYESALAADTGRDAALRRLVLQGQRELRQRPR